MKDIYFVSDRPNRRVDERTKGEEEMTNPMPLQIPADELDLDVKVLAAALDAELELPMSGGSNCGSCDCGTRGTCKVSCNC